MTDVLSTRALNRALLQRQHLLEQADLPPLAMIEHLVGLQAQNPNPPYVGLWTRLRDFRHADLADLVTSGAAVRIVLMRGTVHLVSAADCRTLRPTLQPMLDRLLGGTFGKHIGDLDRAAVAKAAEALLEQAANAPDPDATARLTAAAARQGKGLTTGELGDALHERWPGVSADLLANVVRSMLPLVQLPPRGVWGVGGVTRYQTAPAWLRQPLAAAPDPATLIERYLAAFGPASVNDVQAWSGLTRLREVVDGMGRRLLRRRTTDGGELLDVPDAPLPDPDTPVPPRLVAEFDNVLLGHADRTRIVPEAHRGSLMTRNGLLPGGVLLDGFLAGTWRVTRVKKAATLVVTQLRSFPKRDAAAVESQGRRLLAFAAGDATAHDVQFVPPA